VRASDWISLVAVIVAPLSVMAGAWLNSSLVRRTKATDDDRAALADALVALGRMKALLIDAQPNLVLNNDLREYESPNEAIAGLFQRWVEYREPFVLLSVTHPNEEVRDLAFTLQGDVELLLRMLDDTIKGAKHSDPSRTNEEAFHRATDTTLRLGRLLSPFQG
jgi:hypothetical protein